MKYLNTTLSLLNVAALALTFGCLTAFLENGNVAVYGEFALTLAIVSLAVNPINVVATSGFFSQNTTKISTIFISVLLISQLICFFIITLLISQNYVPLPAILLAATACADMLICSLFLSHGRAYFTTVKSIIGKILFWPIILLSDQYYHFNLTTLILFNAFSNIVCIILVATIFQKSKYVIILDYTLNFSHACIYLKEQLKALPTSISSFIHSYIVTLLLNSTGNAFGADTRGILAYALRLMTISADINAVFRDKFVADLKIKAVNNMRDQLNLIANLFWAPLLIYYTILAIGYVISYWFLPNIFTAFTMIPLLSLIAVIYMIGSYFTFHVYRYNLSHSFLAYDLLKIILLSIALHHLKSIEEWLVTLLVLEILVCSARLYKINLSIKSEGRAV